MQQEMRPNYQSRLSLMEVVGFTSDDIMANRRGLLSNEQKARLRDDHAFWTLLSRIVAVLTAVLIGLAVLDGIRIGDTLTSRIEIVLVALLVGGLLYIETYHHAQQAKRDLVDGQVTSAEGGVELRKIYRGDSGFDYKIGFAGLNFSIEKRILKAFEAGKNYRVYYTPHTRRILSAEPLFSGERRRSQSTAAH